MKVLLLEDERPAREQLTAAVRAWDPTVEFLACIDSVAEACRWLVTEPSPDLILADVRLTDGDSLRIFERVQPQCPVIFVTAYDSYTLDALEAGGIDYVLKPINRRRVAAALDKVMVLRRHFASESSTSAQSEHRQRLLVRRRGEVLAIDLHEVLGFDTEDRLVYLLHRDGHRYVVDKTLGELVRELDPARFFRVNRSCIVSVEAVRGFSQGGKGRLRLSLREPLEQDEAIVSAEHADAFRRWLDR